MTSFKNSVIITKKPPIHFLLLIFLYSYIKGLDRGVGATEILTMTSTQLNMPFTKSKNRTNVYTRCSCKLIMNNEYLGIYSQLFLIIYVTKIWQFHNFLSPTAGPISPFVVLTTFQIDRIALQKR